VKSWAPLIAIVICVAFFGLSLLQQAWESDLVNPDGANRSVVSISNKFDQESTSPSFTSSKYSSPSNSAEDKVLTDPDATNIDAPETNDREWTVETEPFTPRTIQNVLSGKEGEAKKILGSHPESGLDWIKREEENSALLAKALKDAEESQGSEESTDKIWLSVRGEIDEFSAEIGGEADLILNAGIPNAYRNYLVLGSISGTTPGTFLSNVVGYLPLNWDLFTETILASFGANSKFFRGFSSSLDEWGCAEATFCTGGALPPDAAGLVHHLAFILINPCDFVSNPVKISIKP